MTRLLIPDMSCGHCRATVEATLARVSAPGGVEVDLPSRTVTIAGPATPALLAALQDAGYPAQVTG